VWLPLATVALAILLPLTILLGTAWLFGWKFQPVQTGSMAPAMPAGSLAIVQPVDPTRIGPGQLIVFSDPQDRARLVAHRIVRVLPGEPVRYETRGDANTASDPFPVPVTDIRGIVGWSVPGLGGFIGTVSGAPAVALLVVLPLAILVVTELDAYRRRRLPTAAG
jgi:signal peptidase